MTAEALRRLADLNDDAAGWTETTNPARARLFRQAANAARLEAACQQRAEDRINPPRRPAGIETRQADRVLVDHPAAQ